MERTSLTINTPQWNLLQERCPDDGSSRAVGHRAEALAIIHIKRTYAGSQRVERAKGADLTFIWKDKKMSFEIKGTRGSTLAWAKIKVSGTDSFELLRLGAPLLRITNVFERQPVVHSLTNEKDFILRKEPRWSVRRA
jgi:hypothetical protein